MIIFCTTKYIKKKYRNMVVENNNLSLRKVNSNYSFYVITVFSSYIMKILIAYDVAYLDKFKLIKFTYFKVKQIFNGLVYISVIVNLVSSFCAENKINYYKTVRYKYLFITSSTFYVTMLIPV